MSVGRALTLCLQTSDTSYCLWRWTRTRGRAVCCGIRVCGSSSFIFCYIPHVFYLSVSKVLEMRKSDRKSDTKEHLHVKYLWLVYLQDIQVNGSRWSPDFIKCYAWADFCKVCIHLSSGYSSLRSKMISHATSVKVDFYPEHRRRWYDPVLIVAHPLTLFLLE